MSDESKNCPVCKSTNIRFREIRHDWFCDQCDHKWQIRIQSPPRDSQIEQSTSIFISYGRKDAAGLAKKLAEDLRKRGNQVWIDTGAIRPGESWQHEIAEGLRSSRLVIAVMTPHSVRTRNDRDGEETTDSVCISEITFALFGHPRKLVIPVMGMECEPPLAIYHFDYIDLTKWEESESKYESGLEKLIVHLRETIVERSPRYRNWYHYLQPWDFAAFLHEKMKGFTGREWLFNEIDNWRLSTSESRLLLITGDPGVGKSSIVAHLVHHNLSGQVVAYHCCQADTRATLEPWRFVRSIAAMLASRLPNYAKLLESPAIREILGEERCRQDPGSALERGIMAPLSGMSPPDGGSRYILIDALDESLDGNPESNIVELLASRVARFPAWLKVVATTRKEPAVLTKLKGLPSKELRAEDPANIRDLRNYIIERLHSDEFLAISDGHKKNDWANDRIDKIISTLIQKSGGNFLYITQALLGLSEKLKEKGFNIEGFDIIKTMPDGLAGVYEQFFQRKFSNKPDELERARRILEVVCAAKEPLLGSDLADAAGYKRIAEFAKDWRLIAQFLPASMNRANETVYRPFHKSLVDWLTATETVQYSEFGIETIAGHARLAETGWAFYQLDPERLSVYFLNHLPHHLKQIGNGNRLFTLLTDFHYLRKCVEAGFSFETARHCVGALSVIPVSLIEQYEPWHHFIRSQAGTLASYPSSFFQLAFNEAQNNPVAITAEGLWNDGLRLTNSGSKPYGVPNSFYEKINRCSHQFKPACQLTLHGHHDSVSGVAVAAEGRIIASCSDDKTIKIWDGLTGECRFTLTGHGDKVFAVALSKDGSKVVSGSGDRTVKVWDGQTAQLLSEHNYHEGYVLGVAISPDLRTVFSCSEDSTIRIWDSVDSHQINIIKAHNSRVMCLKISKSGNRLISGSRDRSIALWDTATAEELLRITDHEAMVFGVAISPDGSKLASVSQDGTAKLWNALNGKCELVIQCKSEYFYDIDFSSDGLFLVTVAYGGAIGVWDTRSGELKKTFSGHSDHAVSVACAGRLIVSGARDALIKIWSIDSSDMGEAIRGRTATPKALAIMNQGKQLAVGMTDETVKVWETESGKFINSFRAHRSYVLALTAPSIGDTLISGSYDELVRIWQKPFESSKLSLTANQGYVYCLAASSDCQRIIAGHSKGMIRVWDGISGKIVGDLSEHDDSVLSVAIDSDAMICCSASRDSTVRIWDLSTLTSMAVLSQHSSAVRCVAISPDNTLAVSGGEDCTLVLFNFRTKQTLKRMDGHRMGVSCLAFLSANLIASGSDDHTVKIWDLNEGICIATLEGHTRGITALSAGSDGLSLSSASIDGTVKMWSGPNWKVIHELFGNPNKVEKFQWNAATGECWMQRQDGSQKYIANCGTSNKKIKSFSGIINSGVNCKETIAAFFVSAKGVTIHNFGNSHGVSDIPGRYIQSFELILDMKMVACIAESGECDIYLKNELNH